MKKLIVLSLVSVTALLLAGCEDAKSGADDKTSAQQPGFKQMRWYSPDQVARGKVLFAENCASCHKADASGSTNWRQADANGKFPPPPLNGTAHAWHHPLSMLRRTVRSGGVAIGGSMPGFGDKLDAAQTDDVIAWVQSQWSDDIYGRWAKRNAQAAMRKGVGR